MVKHGYLSQLETNDRHSETAKRQILLRADQIQAEIERKQHRLDLMQHKHI